MRRLLALAALVSVLPAQAQDKGKTEFTPSAEYRARYFYFKNPTANKDVAGNDSFAEHRMKLGLNYKANEKFSAHATLLHAADFGSTSNNVGETNASETNAYKDSNNEENFLNVNEAYLNWMISDDFSVRVGRQNFQMGDGTVFAINDWEQNPWAFDGVTGVYEAEFGRFTGLLFNYREHVARASNYDFDQKHSAYGVNFDLKTMPNWMKTANAHVIKDSADAIPGQDTNKNPTVNTNNGQDVIRYGLGASFEFGPLDAKAHYEGQTGKYKNIASTGAKTELDAKGMMYQVEVGFKMEGLMGSRWFAKYHVDSGDSNQNDGEAGNYDPYFYDQHDNAGLMDIFGWGNFTSITLGWTVKPTDNTTAGLTYNIFSRTEGGANAAAPTYQRFGFQNATASTSTSKSLGDEIDLWAEHRYDGGLSTMVRLGYFMPGDYYDNSTAHMGDKVLQVAVEGKLTF